MDFEQRLIKLETFVNDQIVKKIKDLNKVNQELKRKLDENEVRTLNSSKLMSNMLSISNITNSVVSENVITEELQIVKVIDELFCNKLNESSKHFKIQNNIINFFEDLLIEQTATQKKLMDKKLEAYIDDLNKKFNGLIYELDSRLNSATTSNNNLKSELQKISSKNIEKLNDSNNSSELFMEWKKDVENTIEKITDKVMQSNSSNQSRDSIIEHLADQINIIEADLKKFLEGNAESNLKSNKKKINNAIVKNNYSLFNAIQIICEDLINNFSDKMKSLETIFMKSFSNNARFNQNLYKYFVDYIRYNKTDKDKTRILHSKMLNDQFQELQTNNKEELNNFKKLAISFDLKINEINASMMKNKEEIITNLNKIKQSNLQDKEKFNLIEENFNIKFENIKLELKTNVINKDNEIPLNNMKRRYTDYNKKEETESHEEFSSKITKVHFFLILIKLLDYQ